MERDFENLVQILTKKGKTIASMESCTGGGFANSITNVPGSSEVLKFSAITYSNEYKIKMGVNPEIINKYSVYSIETAIEMSKNISCFSNSNYGVGITGKFNRADKNNLHGKDNLIFVNIYDRDNDTNYNLEIEAVYEKRSDNKNLVLQNIVDKLLNILN